MTNNISLLLCFFGLLPSLLPPAAQATTVLSNTELYPSTPGTMGPGNHTGMMEEEAIQYFQAQSFTTGGASYVLGSITPYFDNSYGGGFTMALHSNNGGTPGEFIATLSGNSTPDFGLDSSYAPSSTVTLDADTTYWFVTSINPSVSRGAANIFVNPVGNFTATAAEGWSVGQSAQQSTRDGISDDWNVDPVYALLFEVDATLTAAPEPTRMLLLAVGSFGLILRRRRAA